jgi:hypothetical protein
MPAPTRNHYRLDDKDRIVEVGAAWNDMAVANGGEAAIAEKIIGSNIFDHISGHFTRQFFRDFIDQARTGAPTERAYRCDSPVEKRQMKMLVRLEDERSLLVDHETIKVETIAPSLTLRNAVEARNAVLRCSICARLRLKGGEVWREAEVVAQEYRSLRVVHTVCVSCREAVVADRSRNERDYHRVG